MAVTIFARHKKLWVRFKDPITKKWVNRRANYVLGQEEEARQYWEGWLSAFTEGSTPTGPMTVKQFAEKWFLKRTNTNAKQDENRLRKHALPRLGSLPIASVKPKDIRAFVQDLTKEGKLAPRSILGVVGLLHTMFRDAVEDEHLAANPCQLKRGSLPKKVDADPTWRHEAIYTRDEVEQLISDPRVLWDRRVLYALKFLAGGMRHGEASRLKWRN